MRRLHLRIFFSLLAAILIAIAVTAVFGSLLMADQFLDPMAKRLGVEARIVTRALPARGAPVGEVRRRLERQAEQLELHLALWSARGVLIAASDPGSSRMAAPKLGVAKAGWIWGRGKPLFGSPLPDGRWLTMWPRRAVAPILGGKTLGVLVVLGLCLAAGSYLVARRLTGRLQALSVGVKALGGGDLSTRLPVEGKDEIAHLTRRFNWAADRIQRLVDARSRMLASASHEFRSPLARIRMVLELISSDGDSRQKQRLSDAVADIEELDELIEDLLMASRLEAAAQHLSVEPVDLGAIVAEEGERIDAGATIEGGSAVLSGDGRLIRRLVRNLLENAKRYGGGASAEVFLQQIDSETIRLTVADRGPGVPASERERVFEPFYRQSGHREGKDGGVGLGLALVRQIAEHHRGSVVCNSREGGGTEFVVVLKSLAQAAAS